MSAFGTSATRGKRAMAACRPQAEAQAGDCVIATSEQRPRLAVATACSSGALPAVPIGVVRVDRPAKRRSIDRMETGVPHDEIGLQQVARIPCAIRNAVGKHLREQIQDPSRLRGRTPLCRRTFRLDLRRRTLRPEPAYEVGIQHAQPTLVSPPSHLVVPAGVEQSLLCGVPTAAKLPLDLFGRHVEAKPHHRPLRIKGYVQRNDIFDHRKTSDSGCGRPVLSPAAGAVLARERVASYGSAACSARIMMAPSASAPRIKRVSMQIPPRVNS